MKALSFKLAAIICFFTMIAGCSDNTTEPGSQGSNGIMPLKTGNQWIYKSYNTDTSGAIQETTTQTLTVLGTKDLDGERWYIVRQTGVFDMQLYMLNKPDGLWAKTPDGRTARGIKFPIKAGEKYDPNEFTTPRMNISEGEVHVLSVDFPITVPAGTFSTYAYKSIDEDWDNWDEVNYYTPGIGLIKSEIKLTQGKYGEYSELISYTLK